MVQVNFPHIFAYLSAFLLTVTLLLWELTTVMAVMIIAIGLLVS